MLTESRSPSPPPQEHGINPQAGLTVPLQALTRRKWPRPYLRAAVEAATMREGAAMFVFDRAAMRGHYLTSWNSSLGEAGPRGRRAGGSRLTKRRADGPVRSGEAMGRSWSPACVLQGRIAPGTSL